MHMISIRRAFTGLAGSLGGLVLLFAPTTAADATTAHHAAPEHRACTTGFRGQPDYDRHCLTTGDYFDAKREWKRDTTPATRRAQCRTALRTGMPTLVRETRGDVIFDRYRNHNDMILLTAWAGAAECFRIG